MHGVILAAGEGSRLGAEGGDVPKAFLEIAGRTLYDRQRRVLDGIVDDVTIVLGYNYETVLDEVGSANVVVVEDWDEYDNAESLRRALECIDDDVFVLNGDIVVTQSALAGVAWGHAELGSSVVGCLPGTQTGETAIQSDDGVVTDYGMIPGHRHAGLGIIDQDHIPEAAEYLDHNREEWYPVIYPEIDTRIVTIPADSHVEINRPEDKAAVVDRLPLVFSGGQNAHT